MILNGEVMSSFFRMFFASLLAMVIFSILAFFLVVAFIAGIAKSDKPRVAKNSVLVISMDQPYFEQQQDNPLASFSSNDELHVPGLYDVVRLIGRAKTDGHIKGIYLTGGININGFRSEEHTSELQSQSNLVCRLLLEKKKRKY